MTAIPNDTPFKAQRGEHVIVIDIITGPIVLSRSLDDGVTFKPMTDGNFTVTVDGTIKLGDDIIYKASVPGGDFLRISPADTAIQVDPILNP